MPELSLPHEAVWRRVSARAATSAGRDGTDVQSEPDGVAVDAFFDPISPKAAENKYGVEGTSRPYLVFLDPVQSGQIVEGDVLDRDGVAHVVKAVRRFDLDGDPHHLEVVAEARTRGRQ